MANANGLIFVISRVSKLVMDNEDSACCANTDATSSILLLGILSSSLLSLLRSVS